MVKKSHNISGHNDKQHQRQFSLSSLTFIVTEQIHCQSAKANTCQYHHMLKIINKKVMSVVI